MKICAWLLMPFQPVPAYSNGAMIRTAIGIFLFGLGAGGFIEGLLSK